MSFLKKLFGKFRKDEISAGRNTGNILRQPQKLTVLTKKKEGPELNSLKMSKRKDWRVKALPVWEPGDEILGIYQVEKVISGGMGYIYIAHHKKWNRKLAIKSPNERMLLDKNCFARILREANSWVEMGLHPHVAYCYYVRNIEGIPHIVVEYVEGGNLREWIRKGKCIDNRVNLDLAIQFCHGMEFAHSKGMIHRDIKPENILITEKGVLKITDFGLVRIGKSLSDMDQMNRKDCKAADSSLTLVGTFMGTEGYMAPEQTEDPHCVDERADIFSFGVCLYEMFCNKKPYHITYGPRQEPPNPMILCKDKDFPRILAEVLKKSVQWERTDRYENFKAIRMELVRIYKDLFNEESSFAELEVINLEADGLNNLGCSYWELGRYDKARECFEKAVAKEYLHPQANWNLGNLSELNQSISHPQWKDLTTEMLRSILENSGLSEENVEQRVRWTLERKNFLYGVTMILEGHEDWVGSLSFSPNGQFIASGSRDKTAKIWDVQTGRLLRTLEGHKSRVNSVDFAPGGQLLASASSDGTVKLWDVQTGRLLRTLEGHKSGVNSVDFAPDGRLLASASSDRTVKIWDIRSGQPIKTLERHTEPVYSATFSPDGQLVASISGLSSFNKNATLSLWDVRCNKLLKTLPVNTPSDYEDRTVAFSPDGQFLAAACGFGGTLLWKIKNGQLVWTIEKESGYLSFSPNGQFIVTTSVDHTIKLLAVQSGQIVKNLGYRASILSVIFSRDGRFLALGCSNKRVVLWFNIIEPQLASPKDLTALKKNKIEREHKLNSLNNLISCKKYSEAYQRTVEYWSTEGFGKTSNFNSYFKALQSKGKVVGIKIIIEFKKFESVTGGRIVSFSPDSQLLASEGIGRSIKLWEVQNGKLFKSLDGHMDGVISATFSPDGQFIASGSRDRTVKLWEVQSGHVVKTLEGHKGWVCSVSFSPNGLFIASGSPDRTVKLWEVLSGQPIMTFEGHTDHVHNVIFSPDGKLIASLSGTLSLEPHDKMEYQLKLWDVQNKQLILTLHQDKINVAACMAFSPDGQLLASGSNNSFGGRAARLLRMDNIVRLWEVQSGRLVKSLEGLKAGVHSLIFSPDGKYLVFACTDCTIKLWDIKGILYSRNLVTLPTGIGKLAFSPDYRFLASSPGPFCKEIRLWLIIPELEFDQD